MTTLSQSRAIKTCRQRLGERGMVRFEVLGRGADRSLVLAVARQLAGDGPDAARLRAALTQVVPGGPPRTGGILATLRGSPLVGADLDLQRPSTPGRVVDA